MKIALIGLPQAGKRTLFTLLTGRAVPESRKPGEIIEGVAWVRDPRVDALHGIFQPKKTTYAENNFVLCPDATTCGESYEWLEAARRCHLVCLVVRAFEDDGVYHPAGSVHANRDRENLEAELLLADMELVEKRLERLARESKSGLNPEQGREKEVLDKAMACLEENRCLRELDLTESERATVRSLDLVTFLPVLAVYNVSEEELGTDFGTGSTAVSCQIESEVAAIEEEDERAEFLEALGLQSPGLDRVNAAAYDALGLMSYYTVGEDECRAWTIRKGASAPEAGGVIHTDIEGGFIRAEVMKYDDFIAAGTEAEARNRGHLSTRGRDYIVEDGDIMHFLHSS
ncbi:MAG TPA: redox-regulated ATPase YchF [Candidatus Handelsmanbacteria bacterium]|nr:redox-regulated ATPase YchF [Candidatus Handelsmanbacteria bacterium]